MDHRRIDELIGELEIHAEGVDEEAAASLIAIGAPVIPPLIERVPSLDAGAQLGAIEVLVALNAIAAGPVLIGMLGHSDDRVRSWAAEALGDLQIADAVPHLQSLLRQSKAAGTPPSWSEPTNARHALTQLGARTPVIPNDLEPLLVRTPPLERAVRDEDLDRALDLLRGAQQVVAYFQRWRPWQETWSGVDGASWDLDWDAPWDLLVTQSHEEARTAPRDQTIADVQVTIEWLDRTDWETL